MGFCLKLDVIHFVGFVIEWNECCFVQGGECRKVTLCKLRISGMNKSERNSADLAVKASGEISREGQSNQIYFASILFTSIDSSVISVS